MASHNGADIRQVDEEEGRETTKQISIYLWKWWIMSLELDYDNP